MATDPESAFRRAIAIGDANWHMRRYRVSGDPAWVAAAITVLRDAGVKPPQAWIEAQARARRHRGQPAKADQLAKIYELQATAKLLWPNMKPRSVRRWIAGEMGVSPGNLRQLIFRMRLRARTRKKWPEDYGRIL
jgi:hypothetical protein